MLGLDYGTQQLVLPNWRVEGASNPFSIRLFPGWFTSTAYPFWILVLSSVSAFLYLLPPLIIKSNDFLLKDLSIHAFNIDPHERTTGTILSILWAIYLGFSFRRALYDSNENLILVLTCFIARFLRVRLVESFEYSIYRARLAYYELLRLRIATDSLKPFLIQFEDRTFHKNPGLSIRGIARAIKDYLVRGRISGGSTLTQQLVRTLFIVDYYKTLRRKLIEMPLALWATSQFSKKEILDLYIASVKYERGVLGLAAALRFFFPSDPMDKISKAKAFFLAERVSNTRSRILTDRLLILTNRAASDDLLDSDDIHQLKEVYRKQVQDGRLTPSDNKVFHDWIF